MEMATNATWIKHPGFYIAEELEARGWSQRDLAFILGVPEQAVNMILNGKRGVTPENAKALGDAFEVNPETFANLQKAYDLAHARQPDPGVAVRARMQNHYPVREMIRRGWLQTSSDPAMLEEQLVRFFHVPSPDAIPYMAHAAKRSHYEQRDIPPAQLAWLYRVRQIASSIAIPAYSERSLRTALTDLQHLMTAPEEARHVPKILMDCGVIFVCVEKLPNAKIDGVCFWLNNSPVIGMSMQHDRIDNFWFVVRHEIEHVLQGHGKDEEIIDLDLDSVDTLRVSEEEQIANSAAENFCIPSEKLNSWMRRKHPFYYEKDVVAFARHNARHPGIVVGQIRKKLNRWDYLTRYLVKIRQFVIPASIADGWGQVIPASL